MFVLEKLEQLLRVTLPKKEQTMRYIVKIPFIVNIGYVEYCYIHFNGIYLQCNNRFTALNESKCICTVDEDSDGKPDLERTQVILIYV